MPDYIMGKTYFDWSKDADKLENSAGNHVAIDHLNGEYSLVCHLKRGSVAVREGDSIEQGAYIGQMGFSGSTAFPHIHYELRDGLDWSTSEGLPCYFRDFRRIAGAETLKVVKGHIDTGEIIETMV
jgi:murein DD-endopeptidase MepM/ murein hydrolase activator NlpD